MPGLAESSRTNSCRAERGATPQARNTPLGTAGLASARLIPAGFGPAIPRLDGVPVEQQLWQGEEAVARLCCTFITAGIADPDAWAAAKPNPLAFLKRTLERWLKRHHGDAIQEQFSLDLMLSTSLDRYFVPDGSTAGAVSQVFLVLEPDAAGYIILGPTLQLLAGVHPRLPVTFIHLFLGALNRWVRVYDYCDALDRIESLREWYESDPEGGGVELPDIARSVPAYMKKRPLTAKTTTRIVPGIKNRLARQLLELAIELDGVSSKNERPVIGEESRELLMDCGEPAPALLAVFERNDAIEGCFDEESQGMLELTPEPNLIIPFNGESAESAAGAFAILSTVCETLSGASRVMEIMPGNERLN